jgi:hypothetical protein
MTRIQNGDILEIRLTKKNGTVHNIKHLFGRELDYQVLPLSLRAAAWALGQQMDEELDQKEGTAPLMAHAPAGQEEQGV